MNSEASGQLRESTEFRALVTKRWGVSLALTAAMFLAYFGFILVLAFDKTILAQKIGEHVTIGIPVGVGVIVFAWLLTGIYVWWANRSYDSAVERMKTHLRNRQQETAVEPLKRQARG